MPEKTGQRDLMGSKADMISKKFDEVQRNSIWREQSRKEAKTAPVPNEFCEKKPREDTRLQDAMPMTTSGEVGFRWEKGFDTTRRFSKWKNAKGTSDITRYGDSYYALFGKSPFSKKVSM